MPAPNHVSERKSLKTHTTTNNNRAIGEPDEPNNQDTGRFQCRMQNGPENLNPLGQAALARVLSLRPPHAPPDRPLLQMPGKNLRMPSPKRLKKEQYTKSSKGVYTKSSKGALQPTKPNAKHINGNTCVHTTNDLMSGQNEGYTPNSRMSKQRPPHTARNTANGRKSRNGCGSA